MTDDSRVYQPRSASVYQAAEELLPARTWQDSPAVWIALVAAVLIAVPFMADWATRGDALTPPGQHAAPAASGTPDAAAIYAPPRGTAVEHSDSGNRNSAAPAAAVPPHLRQTDSGRQMITKCFEGGRVVYTQTGTCAGSVTAVPIDANKNVVGPGSAAAAAGSR